MRLTTFRVEPSALRSWKTSPKNIVAMLGATTTGTAFLRPVACMFVSDTLTASWAWSLPSRASEILSLADSANDFQFKVSALSTTAITSSSPGSETAIPRDTWS